SWLGVPTLKCPLDCSIYQEILWETKPDVVIEIGSFAGGSTMFLWHLMDLMGKGEVVSVGIDRSRVKDSHPPIRQGTRDCSSTEVLEQVQRACKGNSTMVIHDGDHLGENVLRDLRAYSNFVSIGNYFIVEDGIMDAFGPGSRFNDPRGGPLEGTLCFLQEDTRFEIDRARE